MNIFPHIMGLIFVSFALVSVIYIFASVPAALQQQTTNGAFPAVMERSSKSATATDTRSLIQISNFTVMTWNVWFGADFFAKRMGSIIDIVLETDPDVACFQEVLGSFHQMMREHPVLMQKYTLSAPGHSYFVTTLTKRSLVPVYTVVSLPTSLGRDLLMSSFVLPRPGSKNTSSSSVHTGERIVVGNVHLESLDAHPVREQQLAASRDALARTLQLAHSLEERTADSVTPVSDTLGTSLLVGDFNFCSERNFILERTPLENDSLRTQLQEYIDVWPALHPVVISGDGIGDGGGGGTEVKERNRAAKGYTFDSDLNGNLEMKRRREVARYDRVMLRSHSGNVSPREIRLLGTERVPGVPADENLFPSDHFGLLARFEVHHQHH